MVLSAEVCEDERQVEEEPRRRSNYSTNHVIHARRIGRVGVLGLNDYTVDDLVANWLLVDDHGEGERKELEERPRRTCA